MFGKLTEELAEEGQGNSLVGLGKAIGIIVAGFLVVAALYVGISFLTYDGCRNRAETKHMNNLTFVAEVDGTSAETRQYLLKEAKAILDKELAICRDGSAYFTLFGKEGERAHAEN